MKFIDDIFSLVWDVAYFFQRISNTVSRIAIIGSTLQSWFYSIYSAFWGLLTPIAHLGDWVGDITDKIESVVSLDAVWSYFRWWFDAAEIAFNWVTRWQGTILTFINSWWQTKLQELLTWWNTELKELRDVKAAWDYFWTVLYPKSVNWDEFLSWWNTELSELQGLINSSIKELEPLWEGWQEWRGKVTKFFTDPEDWLYKAVDRIIERFW